MDGLYRVLPLTAYYRLSLTSYLNTYRSRSSQQQKERKSNIVEEEQHSKETTTTTTTMLNRSEQSNESEDSTVFSCYPFSVSHRNSETLVTPIE